MLLAECMVCFETLESEKVIYASPCGHVLHHACWIGCLRSSGTCPKCRMPTSESRLIKLYITFSEREDSTSLQNKIDELRCELSCRAVDFENAEKKLLVKTSECRRLHTEMERLKGVESEMIRVAETLRRKEREIETWKGDSLKLKISNEELGKLRQQTVELKLAKANLEKFRDQTLELRKVKSELEKLKKEPPMTRKSKEEMDMIRKYQGVVEGLKQCLHEFDQLKKSNQLVKKLKIYTDDISGDVKNDVKKDPQKYVDMFQEVKKFWNWVGKREDEVKKSPKGCVIHLTEFPPDRKDVTKVDIQGRMEYYDAKVAFVTYTRGGKEAFVRLKPPPKRPATQQKDPSDSLKTAADLIVEKLPDGKLRIKNFTVNAVALQGEEELKFLRRSFDDRDRKLGRVNCDLDYFDETEEVTRLEYMMNLVAVA